MEELDTALNELGMLSSCSKYKLEYLKVVGWCGMHLLFKSCLLLTAHNLITMSHCGILLMEL